MTCNVPGEVVRGRTTGLEAEKERLPLMKIVTRRLHCPKCEKLVNGREQVADESRQVFCTRCGSLLRVWDGIKWRRIRPE
jgi:RNase P subunit RPR2